MPDLSEDADPMPEEVQLDDVEAIIRAEPAGEKRELRLWLRLLSCANLIENKVRSRLRIEYDMTIPRFDLMSHLYKEPNGLRLSELSKRMMVSNGNLTALVDRLAGDGYVHRMTDVNDRRAFVVQLTKAGSFVFCQMAGAHEEWLRELMAGLSPEQTASLAEDLAVLKQSVARARLA